MKTMLINASTAISDMASYSTKARVAYLHSLCNEIKLLGTDAELEERYNHIAKQLNIDFRSNILFLFKNTNQMAKKSTADLLGDEPVKAKKKAAPAPEPAPVVKKKKAAAVDLLGPEPAASGKKTTRKIETVTPEKGAKKVPQKEIICELAEEGLGIQEIVEKTGIKANNVRWYFSKLKLNAVVEKAKKRIETEKAKKKAERLAAKGK